MGVSVFAEELRASERGNPPRYGADRPSVHAEQSPSGYIGGGGNGSISGHCEIPV